MERWKAMNLAGIMIPFALSSFSVFSISMIVQPLSIFLRVPISVIFAAIPIDFIGGAIGGLVLGYVADRMGRKPVMLIAIILFSAPLFLAAISTNLIEIFALWFVIGFGVNAQNGVSYPVVVETLQHSTGTMGGLLQSLYFAGFLLDSLASIAFPYWRTFLIACGIIALVPSIAFSIAIRETRKGGLIRYSIRSMRGKLAVYTVAFSAVVAGAFMFSVPLMGVVPTYLREIDASSTTIVFFSLIGLSFFIISGYLSDRVGRGAVAAIFSSLCILSGTLLFVEKVPLYSLFIIAFMYASSGFFSFSGIWVSENYPAEYRVTATNIVFFTGRIIGGFSPLIASVSFVFLGKGIAFVGMIAGAMALTGVILLFLFGQSFRGGAKVQKNLNNIH
ncbi:MAG: MFS transporter [Thermoplasmatales archaeon]